MNQIITRQKIRAWFLALIAAIAFAQDVAAQTRPITGTVTNYALPEITAMGYNATLNYDVLNFLISASEPIEL
ncbi:MAG: hypothetical protein EOP51_27635, partial [Sphingobacteriales bacterium]